MSKVDPLHAIKHRINAGDREGARLDLQQLLETDPDNVNAWTLLAVLLTEPAEQAGCYRQILRIDPGNRLAAAWLGALARESPVSPHEERTSGHEGTSLRCEQCGGLVVVHTEGELRDKGAICPYCGAHLHLPDPLRRQEREREDEQVQSEESWTVEAVGVEMHTDQQPAEWVAPTADELGRLAEELNLLDADEEASRQLAERELAGESGENMVGSSAIRTEERSLLDRLLGRKGRKTRDIDMPSELADPVDALAQTGRLSPGEIIRLAGGPLSPEERCECPSCGAVVSRSATKCPWCSTLLTQTGNE